MPWWSWLLLVVGVLALCYIVLLVSARRSMRQNERARELITKGDWDALVKMGDSAIGALGAGFSTLRFLTIAKPPPTADAAKALLRIGTTASVRILLKAMHHADDPASGSGNVVGYISGWRAGGPAHIAQEAIVEFAVAQQADNEPRPSIVQVLRSLRDEFPQQVGNVLRLIDERSVKDMKAEPGAAHDRRGT